MTQFTTLINHIDDKLFESGRVGRRFCPPFSATAFVPRGQESVAHPTWLNTPREITNTSNTALWRWEGEPFGAQTPNEDVDGDGVKFSFNLRFPGQYYDQETGLNYNYFRDYDAATGRYIQSDPIGLAGGMNTYGYVGGNPVGAVDPLGLYGTNSCSFYSEACKATQGLYECKAATKACPVFPPGNVVFGSPKLGNWLQCVRQCLQEEDKKRRKNDTGCPIPKPIDNPVGDHVDCFSSCVVNPENPYAPFTGKDLPDGNPTWN